MPMSLNLLKHILNTVLTQNQKSASRVSRDSIKYELDHVLYKGTERHIKHPINRFVVKQKKLYQKIQSSEWDELEKTLEKTAIFGYCMK